MYKVYIYIYIRVCNYSKSGMLNVEWYNLARHHFNCYFNQSRGLTSKELGNIKQLRISCRCSLSPTWPGTSKVVLQIEGLILAHHNTTIMQIHDVITFQGYNQHYYSIRNALKPARSNNRIHLMYLFDIRILLVMNHL